MSGEATGIADRIRQVEVPPSVRAPSGLCRIDYADTLFVDISPTARSAAQCDHEILEGAPLAIRARLLSG